MDQADPIRKGTMIMDIVMIKCPNCGGQVNRKDTEFFGRCPYCGSEVAFDAVKEEVQLDIYRDKIDALERNNNLDELTRKSLVKWYRMRNIVLIVMCICICVGFCLVDKMVSSTDLTGFGVFLVIIGLGLVFAGPPLIGFAYPSYNLLHQKEERAGKLMMWLKLTGIFVGSALLSMFAAFVITTAVK